jgi:hypothetical protein
MNEVHNQILHEWFNNNVTINYLVDKYLPNMRKEVILLICDNLDKEHLFKLKKEKPEKITGKEPKKIIKKHIKKDLPLKRKKKPYQEIKPPKRVKQRYQVGQYIPASQKKIGIRTTDQMLEHSTYMPHELKAIIQDMYNAGGWESMSEIIRCAISNYFIWLESQSF